METSLRPYQVQGVDGLRVAIRQGHKDILLWMPGGSGKTVVFSFILKNSPLPCAMVVDGRQLVEQASKRLRREDTPHGVLMAKHWNSRPGERVQICSIDTLASRGYHPKTKACEAGCNGYHLEAKIIIIDESHLALSPIYAKFLAQYPDAIKIWVTATPYDRRGLPCTATVSPINFNEAVLDNYLIAPRYCLWDKGIDLSKVGKSGADFNQAKLAAAMDDKKIIADIVAHWKELGENRPTLCFSVNVATSMHIADAFNKAGIPAAHVDAETPEAEREAQLQRHKEGGLMVICNVNIHSTGVDLPWLGCIIAARPTQSYNLYIQQMVRGTRPYSDRFGVKTDFIILDHGLNYFRHGRIEDEPEALLTHEVEAGKKLVLKGAKIMRCKVHARSFVGFCPECKALGIEAPATEIKLEKEGKLVEVKVISEEQAYLIELNKIAQMARKKDGSKYKRGWKYFMMEKKYGKEVAQKWVPKPKVPDWIRARL